MTVKSVGNTAGTANTPFNVGQAGTNGGTFSLHILNRDSATAELKIGISSTSVTFDSDRILEERFTLLPEESNSYGPIVMAGNDYLVMESTVVNVNGILMGHDE